MCAVFVLLLPVISLLISATVEKIIIVLVCVQHVCVYSTLYVQQVCMWNTFVHKYVCIYYTVHVMYSRFVCTVCVYVRTVRMYVCTVHVMYCYAREYTIQGKKFYWGNDFPFSLSFSSPNVTAATLLVWGRESLYRVQNRA